MLIIVIFLLPGLSNAQTGESTEEPLSLEISLGDWIAIGAIVVGFVYPYVEDRRQERKTFRAVFKTITKELEDTETALGPNSPHKAVNRKTKDDNGVSVSAHYRLALLHDDAYSALINTGAFLQLSSGTQIKLALLYNRVRRHNELLRIIDEIENDTIYADEGSEQEKEQKFHRKIRKYELALTKRDAAIINGVKDARDSLEKEKPRSFL
jgi:hypothetical protein